MSDSSDLVPPIAVRLLPAEGEKLREDLIKLLGKRKLDSATLVSTFESHEPDLVRKVLPTVISRLIIDKKSQDQARAELIREAVLQLENKHNFDFRWNDLYKNFIRGLTTTSRVTENDIHFVKRVFGENYVSHMDLSTTTSAVRQLRPLGSLMERLNMDVDTIRDYLFRVRDERIQRLAGTQGLRRHVVNDDIAHVKLELNRLMWTKRKRSEDDDIAGRGSKRQKTYLSKEIINDEDDEDPEAEVVADAEDDIEGEARSGNGDGHEQEEDLGEEAEDVEPLQTDKVPKNARMRESTRVSDMRPRESVLYPRIAPPAQQRTFERVAKNGKQLAHYPGVRQGPQSGSVMFGDWSESAFVHGHGVDGTFAFDDDHGTLRHSRLVGFHDSFKRQYGKDYLNSWIVLPRASSRVLEDSWTTLSEMLNFRALAYDDANLNRRKPGDEGLHQVLLNGGIPFIENAGGYRSYPYASTSIGRMVKSSEQAILYKQLHDGSKGPAEPVCDLYDAILESEKPEHKRTVTLAEHVISPGSTLPRCVEEELHFGIFATTDCSDRLRPPKAKNPEVAAALRAVGRAMPLRYGENYGGKRSDHANNMLQTVEAPLHTWEQELYWRDGNPETLIRDGPYVSVVQRLSFLELEAQNHFESRGIVGFAGSCRARTTPVAGSLLWSLLHRGERLVFLWGPQSKYRRAIVVVQRVGDLIIIPPGHDYGWYNIRTCLGEEGCFYDALLLESRRTDTRMVPGTLDVLLRSPSVHQASEEMEALCAYFMLIVMITDLTLQDRALSRSLLQRIVRLLTIPVFSYLPICRRENDPQPDPSRLTRMLAWTAPFAAVALKRAVQLCTTEIPIEVEGDSLSVHEVEIWTQSGGEDPQSLGDLHAFDDAAPLLPTLVACEESERDPIETYTDPCEEARHQEQDVGEIEAPSMAIEGQEENRLAASATEDLGITVDNPSGAKVREPSTPCLEENPGPRNLTLTQEIDFMRDIIEATGDAGVLSMGASFSSGSADDS